MQPKPTSAHRKPTVYIPPELADATHVFVRRGGVQPTFAAPFEGPFRVVERLDTGYRVLLPGGRQEIVALARLKPAHVDADDILEDPEQQLDDARPPSPPPPGRRPGPRTRFPAPTDRVTRQTSRNNANNLGSNPSASTDAGPSTSRNNTNNMGSIPTASTDAGPSSTQAQSDVSSRRSSSSSSDLHRTTSRRTNLRRTTRSATSPSAATPAASVTTTIW